MALALFVRRVDFVDVEFGSRANESHGVAEGVSGERDVGRHFDYERLYECQVHRVPGVEAVERSW
ncbi:hypothetical protein GCM10009749_29370 [Agromyces neolithicus]|uniref:Uncharacterized protein n=1 Tax=Agromyces neolithicus TaxID=269420 RepID=A0ABN2MBM9_9MICO